MEKITWITTVYNEQEHIGEFVDSLLQQSKLPDEVIVVDGESTDSTYKLLMSFSDKFKKKLIPYVVLQKKCNRAEGRNRAIQSATHTTIAVSDAGCVLKKNWLATITTPFSDSSIDVVAGYYEPGLGTVFQQCLATYTGVMPDKLNKDFLPSSRSVAFRKVAWKKVGGYPVQYAYNEDLLFAKALQTAGAKMVIAPEAIVTWPQRKNIVEAARQFFWYARGDGQAHYIRPQTPFLFLRYAIAGLLLITALSRPILWLWLLAGFIAYLLWAIHKNYHYVRTPLALIILPTLQLVADLAVISGMTLGILERMLWKKL